MTQADHHRLILIAKHCAFRLGVRDYHELLSPGWEGLEAARRRYDPRHSSGALFWTFANTCIFGAMRSYVRGSKNKHRFNISLIGDFDRHATKNRGPSLDDRDEAAHALRGLRPRHRQAFVMREAFDFSVPEIGEKLGVSSQRVSQLLVDSRKQLGIETIPRRWVKRAFA